MYKCEVFLHASCNVIKCPTFYRLVSQAKQVSQFLCWPPHHHALSPAASTHTNLCHLGGRVGPVTVDVLIVEVFILTVLLSCLMADDECPTGITMTVSIKRDHPLALQEVVGGAAGLLHPPLPVR